MLDAMANTLERNLEIRHALEEHARLSGQYANQEMRRPRYTGPSPRGAILRGLRVTWGNFSGVDFSGADLRTSDFLQANLSRANFTGANIDGARMLHINRRGAIGLPKHIPVVQNTPW